MQVLVVSTVDHAETLRHAAAITDRLLQRGIEVAVHDIADPGCIGAVDAVILGGAVYAGSWLHRARRFVAEHAELLQSVPVWMFSSDPGDLASTPRPRADDVLDLTDARDPKLYLGHPSAEDLVVAERLVIRVVHAGAADFQSASSVTEWADEIADDLLDTDTDTGTDTGNGRAAAQLV